MKGMNYASQCLVFCLFMVLVQLGACYNILVIFGHPGKSHYDVFKPLFQELGERGHNITIISHVRTQGDIKNGRDVLLSDNPLLNYLDLKNFPGNRQQKYLETNLIAVFADMTCEPALQNQELQNFLKEDHQFDVILTEFFNSNCFYGLISKYKAPFIGLSSCAPMAWHAQWFGAPDNPSYIPSIYMAYPSPMTFMERVENTIMHFVNLFWYSYFMERPGRKLSMQYTGYEAANPYNASLYLMNIHHSLHGVRPLTPSMVEVGGIHVATRQLKRLPKEIEKWTNESTSGLIYFSLGSLIKGHTFPDDQLQAFINVFARLPQRILWKWENETMTNKSDNIMLTKWAPQFDVLCHPNTVLFISHGGLLGTTEAVHCGVPFVVMPQFGDQSLNAKALEKHGAGVILKLGDATEESIADAIGKAMSQGTKEKSKQLSERFRDRLVPPLETSVFWVEHIARNKGGMHMRSDAIDMPLYQYFLLDVTALFLLIFIVINFAFYKIFKLVLTKCIGKQKVKLS